MKSTVSFADLRLSTLEESTIFTRTLMERMFIFSFTMAI